jgi:O-acetyl-ADP-ribose deacetylase (regulator of RNase III)
MITYEKRDIFTLEDWPKAHCIASDALMGAGIAADFVKKYPGIKRYCRMKKAEVGTCIKFITENDEVIYNLVTKQYSREKPTYGSLQMALEHMKRLMMQEDVKRIAMPKIGCGLDRLSWQKVQLIIMDTFRGTDVEILVCLFDNKTKIYGSM